MSWQISDPPSEAYTDAIGCLHDMETVRDETDDTPDKRALDNAKAVLGWIRQHSLLTVYPDGEGGVMVDAAFPQDGSHRVVVICHRDGSGMLLEQQDGTPNWRSHCGDVSDTRMRECVTSAVLGTFAGLVPR